MDDEKFKWTDFLFYAWHSKWSFKWFEKQHRSFGPYNLGWYDGPHYGCGFWFFNIHFT